MSKSGLIKCRKVIIRERSTHERAPRELDGSGNLKIQKKQTMYQWVRAEIARNAEMLKSLGLELA